MLRRVGLDPAQHDVPELHAAWLLLESHMPRLRTPPAANTKILNEQHTDRHPAIQALGVFSPHEFIRTCDESKS